MAIATGTAILGSALLGVGASIYSGKKASSASQAATAAGVDTQWAMYQQAREDYAPWREAGERSLETVEGLLEEGPGEFKPEETPGYEFGFKNFIEDPYLSTQSSKGKRLSGETTKGLTKYAMDYAETAYDNFLARYYQKLTPQMSVAGLGFSAAGGQAGAAGAAGGNIAGLQYQNAINQGNYQTQMASGVTGAAQSGMQNWLDYKAISEGSNAGNALSGAQNTSSNIPYSQSDWFYN